jgi:hypothetical protein
LIVLVWRSQTRTIKGFLPLYSGMIATTRPKIAYVGAHLPTYYAHETGVFERSITGLERLGTELGFDLHIVREPLVTRAEGERVAAELEAAGVDLALLQNSTFVMGDVILPFVGRSFRLGLWATEEPTKEGPILLNNFVSLNLNAGILTRYLREQAVPFKWFYGEAEHPWFGPRLGVTVRALRSLKRLSEARVGFVGGLAPTFYNLAFDERKLRARFGSEVFAHELGELIARAHKVDDRAIREVVTDLTAAAEGRVEVSEEHMRLSASLYLAMREFAAENDYRALAISDWPQFQTEMGIHPGMAFSWLDERDRIPVASEGDVLGAVTMLILNEVSGSQSMLLDMNDLDFERQAALMWHCGGSPLHFADEAGVSWKNHSTLGRKVPGSVPMGVVADFVFQPQEATITRVERVSARSPGDYAGGPGQHHHGGGDRASLRAGEWAPRRCAQ